MLHKSISLHFHTLQTLTISRFVVPLTTILIVAATIFQNLQLRNTSIQQISAKAANSTNSRQHLILKFILKLKRKNSRIDYIKNSQIQSNQFSSKCKQKVLTLSPTSCKTQTMDIR